MRLFDLFKTNIVIEPNSTQNLDLNENFADGKKPGRKGLSKRLGIPKNATILQLEKIAKSSKGERRRMAQWQLNMRRGKMHKVDEQVLSETGLTAKELIKHGGYRLQMFLDRVKDQIPFTIEATGKEFIADPSQYDELKVLFDKMLAGEPVGTVYVKGLDGQTLPTGSLLKDKTFGGGAGKKGFNVGNISEGLLGIAIALKYSKGQGTISTSDVYNLLTNIREQKENADHEYVTAKGKKGYAQASWSTRKNQNKIDLIVKLDRISFDTMIGHDHSGFGGVVNSSVLFANQNRSIENSIKELETGKKANTIEIISDGVSEQTGTKVDVKVLVNDEPIDLKISLKAGDVKQFGQVGNMTPEALDTFFDKLFGETLPKSVKDAWTKGTALEAATQAYSHVAEKVKQYLQGANPGQEADFVSKLAKGIQGFARGQEENVVLVNLKNAPTIAGYSALNFENLQNKLETIDLGVEIKLSATENKTPTIVISEKNKPENVLIKARLKVEHAGTKNEYARNYVEMGSLLKKLAGTEGFEMDKSGNIVDITTGETFKSAKAADQAIADQSVGLVRGVAEPDRPLQTVALSKRMGRKLKA